MGSTGKVSLRCGSAESLVLRCVEACVCISVRERTMCSRAFRAPLARCRETTFSPRDWISAATTPAWSAPPNKRRRHPRRRARRRPHSRPTSTRTRSSPRRHADLPVDLPVEQIGRRRSDRSVACPCPERRPGTTGRPPRMARRSLWTSLRPDPNHSTRPARRSPAMTPRSRPATSRNLRRGTPERCRVRRQPRPRRAAGRRRPRPRSGRPSGCATLVRHRAMCAPDRGRRHPRRWPRARSANPRGRKPGSTRRPSRPRLIQRCRSPQIRDQRVGETRDLVLGRGQIGLPRPAPAGPQQRDRHGDPDQRGRE